MTVTEWFWFFMAAIGWVVGWVGSSASDKKEEENKQLRESLLIEHNRAEYFRKKAEHNAVFDFEKVNKKGEK